MARLARLFGGGKDQRGDQRVAAKRVMVTVMCEQRREIVKQRHALPRLCRKCAIKRASYWRIK